VPPESSASYRKKVKSFLSGFLHYCHSQGWIAPALLVAADRMEGGDMTEDHRWLTPEQLAIYDRVIAESEALDWFHEFVWELYRDNGLRTAEGISLTPASLETGFDGYSLKVRGKGRGAGKVRSIPQAETNVDSFLRHVARHNIRPNGPVLFQRRWLLLKGEKDVMGWVDDRTRPASSKAINGVFARIQAEVNRRAADGEFSPREVPQWPLTAKVMRKTFACNQLILARLGLGGMDLETLQEVLGHSSLTTTKVYLADVNKYLGQTVKRVSTGDAARMIVDEKKRLDEEKRRAAGS
jgi:site-specific recombinase XerD